ncbi:uncharacterized protein LOC107045679 [Diachasma alloeum]|uniref:uncharacterized protein LOC107045679 n=1 Tax=Diachasma alloeum TaxID=454923 RepID=UPI000738455D|nr:uncharacterized protein LOC107045679 [Diachasma alloeum]
MSTMALTFFSVVFAIGTCSKQCFSQADVVIQSGLVQPSTNPMSLDDLPIDYQSRCSPRLHNAHHSTIQYQSTPIAHRFIPMISSQYYPRNLLFSETQCYQGINRLIHQQITGILPQHPNQMMSMDTTVGSALSCSHLQYLRPHLFKPDLQTGRIFSVTLHGLESLNCNKFPTYNGLLWELPYQTGYSPNSKTDDKLET